MAFTCRSKLHTCYSVLLQFCLLLFVGGDDSNREGDSNGDDNGGRADDGLGIADKAIYYYINGNTNGDDG